jgi:retron-type reverse transcriptase
LRYTTKIKLELDEVEKDFLPCSWGYRPEIGPLDAVKDIGRSLMTGKFGYIADADIAGFFDNIVHEWMERMLEQRIADRAFIRSPYIFYYWSSTLLNTD